MSTALLLSFYLAVSAKRGLSLIQVGGFAPLLIGISSLGLPILGGWVLWREWQFGKASAALGAALKESGQLPLDDLPKRPSGRAVRADADARFQAVRDELAMDPGDWGGWFALSVAYDAAGDRKRARAAMREAIALRAAQE